MGIKEFDLLKRIQELQQSQQSGNSGSQEYLYDGIVSISNSIVITKKDKTKEIVDSLKFFVLNIGEVFYRVKRLKQFFSTHYNINYEVFKSSLDEYEQEILGRYFGKKRKLIKDGYKISKEDSIFVSERLIIPILDTTKKKYILTIDNSKIIKELSNLFVEIIHNEYKILLDKETKDTSKGISLFTITNTDEGLKLTYKVVKLSGTVDDVLEDIYDFNYEKLSNDLEKFVLSSKVYTENKINEIKRDIINKMRSFVEKYDDENSEVVSNIVTSINNKSTSKSIDTNTINKKVQQKTNKSNNIINVDDVLSELTSNINTNDETINIDDLLSDEESDIPF